MSMDVTGQAIVTLYLQVTKLQQKKLMRYNNVLHGYYRDVKTRMDTITRTTQMKRKAL